MKLEPVKRLNFLGGINRSPLQGEGQAKLLQNARPLRSAGIQVRYGQTLEYSVGADPTVGSITDIFPYKVSGESARVYSLRRTGAGDKFFDNTTEITGPTLSGAAYTSIVEGKGTIFISNGDSGDIQYHVPGTTVRAVITNSFAGNSLPQGQFLAAYKNRLYSWTNTGLYYTNTNLYTTLPALHFSDANLIKIREENATATGMVAGSDAIALFTADAVTIMTGTPGNNGALNTQSLREYSGIGSIAPRTQTAKGSLIVWMTPERRMWAMQNGSDRDLDSSDFIAEYLYAAENLISASAKLLGKELWLSLPKGSSANDRRLLVYDIELDKWIAEFTGIEGYAIGYMPEINAVYVASHTGGYIWRQGIGSYKPTDDAGSLIPFKWTDGQLVFGSLWHKKYFEKILIATNMAYSETLNFKYSTNQLAELTSFELNPSITTPAHNWGDDYWGEYPWGETGLQVTTLRPKQNYNLSAYSMNLDVSGNVSGGTMIYGYEAHAFDDPRDVESGV